MLLGADALRFWKVESIGNHFPLVQIADTNGLDLPQLAIEMCRHHFGIGGDGLLTLEKTSEGIELRMFNPDGTEDFCGNGIRCAAQWITEQGWAKDHFTINHRGKAIDCTVAAGKITTEIGTASYIPEDVPTNIHGEIFDDVVFAGRVDGVSVILHGSALSTGSTHVIIPTGSLPTNDNFVTISKQLENDPRFPNRTSVIWSMREEKAIRIRIWERGVGETLGCGTGSSAAAIDFMRRRGEGGTIEVRNPGGTVWVRADHWNRDISISGEAKVLFEGDWVGSKVSVSDPVDSKVSSPQAPV